MRNIGTFFKVCCNISYKQQGIDHWRYFEVLANLLLRFLSKDCFLLFNKIKENILGLYLKKYNLIVNLSFIKTLLNVQIKNPQNFSLSMLKKPVENEQKCLLRHYNLPEY